MLVDTHCHIDQPPLCHNVDGYLSSANAAGIRCWLVPGIHPDGWKQVDRLCKSHRNLFSAFGIHPCNAAIATDADLVKLEKLAPSSSAIGEIGLDRNCGGLERQEIIFRHQIRIARRHRLPLLIHCCKMTGRLLEILFEEKADAVGGIMHGYSGSVESARSLINIGFAIGVGDTALRPDSTKFRRLVQELPLSSFVLESDAPSQRNPDRNNPLFLKRIVTALAEASGKPEYLVEAETGSAALRVIPRLRG